jgi:diguanylate cyclase (GGDEF)-like protein
LTTLLAAGIAAVAVLVAAFAALLAARRSRRLAEARVADVVTVLNARMDELARELEQTRKRAEEENRRSRLLGELSGSIDLDDVLSRVLQAAGSLPNVDAALVMTSGQDGKPLIATLGLSPEEAEQKAITGPPDGRAARSVALSYIYSAQELESDDALIHAGLAVPLPGDPEPVGYLTIFTRRAGATFGEATVDELEALAVRAAPAIDNARRFREARQLADLDALTGLHNRRFFHETLAREVARAHRYERRLGLIVLDVDDFKEVNDRIGHLAGDGVLAEAAARIRDVVRSADVACRVGGDEFAVILPESGADDADQLYRRIQQSVSGRPMRHGGTLHFSAGVAEQRPADDAAALFQRADEALYRAKESGKGRVVAAGT